MRDKGSAMLTSVVIIMILLTISGTFFSLVNNKAKIGASEEKAMKAYYLAQAGVNYWIALVVKAGDKVDGLPTSVTTADPFGTGNGYFIATWSQNTDGTYTITSRGFYSDVTRVVEAIYQLGGGGTYQAGLTHVKDTGQDTANGWRIFAITDNKDDKGNSVMPTVNGKSKGVQFPFYVFVVNNAYNSVNNDMSNVTVELVDAVTRNPLPVAIKMTYPYGSGISPYSSNDGEMDFTTSYAGDALVRIKVTGTITQGNDNPTLTVYSNCFPIGSPGRTCESVGGLIQQNETSSTP